MRLCRAIACLSTSNLSNALPPRDRFTTCRLPIPTAQHSTSFSPSSALAPSTRVSSAANTWIPYNYSPFPFSSLPKVATPQGVEASLTDFPGLWQVVGEYNKRIYKIYNEWKVKNSTTFALQIQPFTQNRTPQWPRVRVEWLLFRLIATFTQSLFPACIRTSPTWTVSIPRSTPTSESPSPAGTGTSTASR
jgi:hypothetical protein